MWFNGLYWKVCGITCVNPLQSKLGVFNTHRCFHRFNINFHSTSHFEQLVLLSLIMWSIWTSYRFTFAYCLCNSYVYAPLMLICPMWLGVLALKMEHIQNKRWTSLNIPGLSYDILLDGVGCPDMTWHVGWWYWWSWLFDMTCSLMVLMELVVLWHDMTRYKEGFTHDRECWNGIY